MVVVHGGIRDFPVSPRRARPSVEPICHCCCYRSTRQLRRLPGYGLRSLRSRHRIRSHDSVLLLRRGTRPRSHPATARCGRRGVGGHLNDSIPITAVPAEDADRRRGPGLRFIPVILLACFAAQSLWFIGTQSLTYDEPGHIIAGIEAWQHGRFELWTDHPPLGRFWLTLPLARARVEITQQQLARGYRVTAMQPGPQWLAWHTRPMNTMLGLALGVAVWFATRRLVSEGAANVALALFCFTPSLIAHFSVTTTDGIGALFVFLMAWQFVVWRRNPGRKLTVIMGLVLGGLLLAKLYTPPVVVLALVLMVLVRCDCGQRSRLNWRPALAALVIALITFWAGYLFHVSHLKAGNGQVVASFPNRPT